MLVLVSIRICISINIIIIIMIMRSSSSSSSSSIHICMSIGIHISSSISISISINISISISIRIRSIPMHVLVAGDSGGCEGERDSDARGPPREGDAIILSLLWYRKMVLHCHRYGILYGIVIVYLMLAMAIVFGLYRGPPREGELFTIHVLSIVSVILVCLFNTVALINNICTYYWDRPAKATSIIVIRITTTIRIIVRS